MDDQELMFAILKQLAIIFEEFKGTGNSETERHFLTLSDGVADIIGVP